MLRNQMTPSFRRACAVALAAATAACLPMRNGHSGAKDGESRQAALGKFEAALAGPASLAMAYAPLWLVGDAPGDGKSPRPACFVASGISDDDNNAYFSLRTAATCPLLDGKATATLLHMDSFHSLLRDKANANAVWALRRIPVTGAPLAACKDAGTQTVKGWKDIPGSDAFSDSVKEALEGSSFTEITLLKGRALVVAKGPNGIDFFPAPAMCGLGGALGKGDGDAAAKAWAAAWGELVQTEDSYYADAHFFAYKMLSAPHSYWYRQFARVFLGQKWRGGALDFQAGETEATAAKRLKAALSRYVTDALVGEVTLVPTLHPDEKGEAHCFSWTPLTKPADGTRPLTYGSYRPWVAEREGKRFRDLGFPTLYFRDKDPDAPGAQGEHAKHFQIRYALGQFTLDDKSDMALMMLPLNESDLGHPVCYADDGNCALHQGPVVESGRSCQDAAKAAWR